MQSLEYFTTYWNKRITFWFQISAQKLFYEQHLGNLILYIFHILYIFFPQQLAAVEKKSWKNIYYLMEKERLTLKKRSIFFFKVRMKLFTLRKHYFESPFIQNFNFFRLEEFCRCQENLLGGACKIKNFLRIVFNFYLYFTKRKKVIQDEIRRCLFLFFCFFQFLFVKKD